MILHLSQFYKQYASEFLGIQEVRAILEFVEKSFPDLVKEVTRLVPLQKLTEIFRRLVQEQVSIKDLRTILESLSEWGSNRKRYRSINRICPLFIKTVHQLQILSGTNSSFCLFSRS